MSYFPPLMFHVEGTLKIKLNHVQYSLKKIKGKKNPNNR